ncbi:MAG: hypothetical protein IAF38_00060 [Bacteroidia bacterium]|nr:hypothetical protein [Bacteroidia bacterium]
MKILKIILIILCFLFLTALTQIGGLVYLLSFVTYKFINRKTDKKAQRITLKFFSFLILYSFFTFLIVPVIAKPLGRVRLPVTETDHLKPLNILTCFFNRNYVRPELKESALSIARKLNQKYPGTSVNYLEANFPFFNKFPLLPHLSHSDGKKLDLSFCYLDSKTQKQTNKCPSFIGYGICEEALLNEKNTACECSEQGYWQYSLLKVIVPQSSKKKFDFDATRTKDLIEICCKNPSIGKIFLEPHLKKRLNLNSGKIKFHSCKAARHDDHVHIQMN